VLVGIEGSAVVDVVVSSVAPNVPRQDVEGVAVGREGDEVDREGGLRNVVPAFILVASGGKGADSSNDAGEESFIEAARGLPPKTAAATDAFGPTLEGGGEPHALTKVMVAKEVSGQGLPQEGEGREVGDLEIGRWLVLGYWMSVV